MPGSSAYDQVGSNRQCPDRQGSPLTVNQRVGSPDYHEDELGGRGLGDLARSGTYSRRGVVAIGARWHLSDGSTASGLLPAVMRVGCVGAPQTC